MDKKELLEFYEKRLDFIKRRIETFKNDDNRIIYNAGRIAECEKIISLLKAE